MTGLEGPTQEHQPDFWQEERHPPASTDERGTPQWLFSEIERRYAFDSFVGLDVCASSWNAKRQYHFGEADNGLGRSWDTVRVAYCNPPYSNIPPWLAKGLRELTAATLLQQVIYLLPVRTSTHWYAKYRPFVARQIMLPFRVAFDYPPGETQKSSPYESSMLWLCETPMRRP